MINMSKIKEKIFSLIKELPEDTTSEEIEDLIELLYIKKQILEGLEDFRRDRSYSLEEMKNLSRKWKLEYQKRQNDS